MSYQFALKQLCSCSRLLRLSFFRTIWIFSLCGSFLSLFQTSCWLYVCVCLFVCCLSCTFNLKHECAIYRVARMKWKVIITELIKWGITFIFSSLSLWCFFFAFFITYISFRFDRLSIDCLYIWHWFESYIRVIAYLIF